MKTHHFFLFAALVSLFASSAKAQCSGQSFQVTNVITPPCDHDGAVDLTVSGGLAPYTFAWRFWNQTAIISSAEDLTGATGRTYSVEIRDANNICATYNVALPAPFQIYGTTTPAHCPALDGTVAVTASGGNIPYSYLWSNGGITSTLSNVTSGLYDVTVTDAAGCKVIASETDSAQYAFYVRNSNNDSLQITSVYADCTNLNGSATVATVYGGTPPYSYFWSDTWNGSGATWITQTITNISSGSYRVSVTDANSCIIVGYTYIGTTSPVNLSPASTSENCNHQDGTATVVANGSVAPYTYLWSTGATTQNITGLSAGAYSVTVHDANGCLRVSSVYVNRYSPIHANLTTTNESCHNNGGTAISTPTLGTPPYLYSWSNGQTTASINNLTAGFYYVSVSDNAGCSVGGYAWIYDVSPITPNANYIDAICAGALGSATLNPTGGTPPYTFLWSNGATTAAVTNLTAGNYSYTITDANNCDYSSPININLNSGLSGNAFTTNNETCLSQNGAANCTFTGGAVPYSYLWSNGATGTAVTNLSAGHYYVTVTDANGCQLRKNAIVHRISPMRASLTVTPATCIFANDGSASVSLTNGTPPYTYRWGNGSTNQTASNLDANWGIGVWVTDANGCSAGVYENSVGYQNLNCAAIIRGKVVDDINTNCVIDAG
ncbi:MAG: SprB repeat-containing protein, partial [Bacteroidota bacterium]